ncbi:MAG: FAD-dependent oxidoreductase [Gammaproteobacteria bacterium]|nr:FAD-dependent oxidoreductase [Gammaproteobacteria bacterium]
MGKLVIIGSGMAGYTLAREFRKRDQDTELLIITNDDGHSYSKPMLSNAFDKNKTPDTLIMASAEKMADDLAATIWTNTNVTDINETDRIVITDQESVQYDKLVLANGAYSIRAPVSGSAADAIITVNNLSDYRTFRSHINDTTRIVIIGAGLIGCEFANDLSNIDSHISLVDLSDQPLGRLLSPHAAETLKQKLSSLGINWYLNNSVTEVNHKDDYFSVTLADGTNLDADIVLSAIGLRADLQLADKADIETERGIKVNRFLRSSNEHIYALGDCAQVDGLNLPFVTPLMNSARALAATLSGEETAVKYPAMPVVVKTPCYPIVVCPPPRPVDGDWEEEIHEGDVRSTFKDTNGRAIGFVLTGDLTKERMAMGKLMPDWLE